MRDSLVESVDQVCRDVIEPAAGSVDADVVPRSHLDALAATGIFAGSLTGSASPADVRAAHERLAGACLSTWFVVAQHRTPVSLVRDGPQPVRDAVLPLLLSGTSIAGIAFSHLRRWPDNPVGVERVPAGWRFDGVAPWYTGWGINDVAVLAAASADGDAVFALVPADAQAGLVPGAPMDTVAVAAARTVPLMLDGLTVPDEGVLSVQPIHGWLAADRLTTTNVSPAVLGVAQAAADRLQAGPDRVGREVSAPLLARIAAVRDEAYALIDGVEPGHQLGRRLELRARGLSLCLQTTNALVVSRGGRAMLRSDDAQLLARWALFLTVQAQTSDLRGALLRELASR